MDTVRIAAALSAIGQGFIDLAEALQTPGSEISGDPVDDLPKPEKEKAPRSGKKVPDPDPTEEPDEPFPAEEEERPLELADLQKLAKGLIKAGGREKLLAILEKHELANVSSAPKKKWPALMKDLQEAA